MISSMRWRKVMIYTAMLRPKTSTCICFNLYLLEIIFSVAIGFWYMLLYRTIF